MQFFFHNLSFVQHKMPHLFRVPFVQKYTISIFTCNFCTMRCFCYCCCFCFCWRLNKLCSRVYTYMHACTLKYVFHLIPLSFPLRRSRLTLFRHCGFYSLVCLFFFFFLLIIKCFWLRFFPMHLNPPKMIFAEQEKSWLRQFVDFCFYLQMRNHFFHSLFRLSYAKNALHCLFNTMEIKKISISIRTFWQRDEYLLIENREKKSHHKNTVLNWLTGCLAGWIIIIINQYSFNFYCVYTHYTRRDRDI